MLISSVWRGASRWWFSAGLLAGGLTSSLVVVALGTLLRPLLPISMAVGVVLAVFVVVALQEFGLFRLRLPQNARQVPESISTDGARYGALHFGFEMGSGVRTYMTSGLPHVLAAGVLLVAGWPAALLSGLAFGTGRALMTLSRHAYHDDGRWDRSLTRHDTSIRVLMTFATALALGSILYTAVAGAA
jgi:thiol:disulfide interchange protein